MPDTGIGACVRREDDRRFLSGKSRCADDLSRPGLSSAVFVRWLPTHAKAASINTDAAVGGSLCSQACDDIIDKGKKIAVHLLADAVEDFGRVINPTIMEDHFHGGIAQGVSQAMLENCLHDANGQSLTGSYLHYRMPRTDDLPFFKIETTVSPCPHNPLGVKGCGEAGAIAAPTAFMNAVTDAPGTGDITMPASPEKVWQIAQMAQAAEYGRMSHV